MTTLAIPLAERVAACTACGLRAQCRKPVPARGPATARVLIVGDMPGYMEDVTGRAWSGEPGKLIAALLDYVGLDPTTDVAYTNLLKCRPRRGYEVSDEERAFCAEQWLAEEIAEVQPEIVVPVGPEAARYFIPGMKNLESVERVVHRWREE